MHEVELIWSGLIMPMLRLLLGLSLGLLLANILEALRWTKILARFASPLAQAAHLSDVSAAAFSTAFVSPAAANGLLAEEFEKGTLSRREVVLSNIFNSLPSFMTHTPSIFLLTYPVLGYPAVIYVGITLAAAVIRTCLTIVFARFLLPKRDKGCVVCHLDNTKVSLGEAVQKAWARFKKRLPKLIYFTVPVYVVVFILQRIGAFQLVEKWLAEHASFIPYVDAEALGIVALHLAAELGAALSAAGALLHGGSLSSEQVVLALLVGNILSTPARAIRHQLPSYSGFFAPKLALQLVVTNQLFRAASLVVFTGVYAYIVR